MTPRAETPGTPVPEGLPGKIPQHVAIIMDGNGRWATARNLPRLAGHRAGTENSRLTLNVAFNYGGRDERGAAGSVFRLRREPDAPPGDKEGGQYLYTAGT